MAGGMIDPSAQLSCPHGGKVTVTTANGKARTAAGGLVLASDTLTVVGCPFTLPGPKPSPCLTVKWSVADTKVKVNGTPTVSQTSVGLCYSGENLLQGPVQVTSTQPRVRSR